MALQLSEKGEQLIQLYKQMAQEGYERGDGENISPDDAFADFESRALRADLRKLFEEHKVESVMDYGCGGSDWDAGGFDPDSGQSAREFYGLKQICRFEPARDIDERQVCDAVLSFDVLEHIFISDIPRVVRDHFEHARKLLIVNVACYPAEARLPDNTNAHITVRSAHWWKGMFDAMTPEYPEVKVLLVASPRWRNFNAFPIFSDSSRQLQEGFVISD